MPRYDYQCPKCGSIFEVEKAISLAGEDERCMYCEDEPVMKKIPSLSTFHLKGGGWAKDNYGNKK